MNRFFGILIALLAGLPSYSQQYADPAYYLVDSLDLSRLTSADKQLVDSCLNIFHQARNDSEQVGIINIIVEESWDDGVWPKYNDWIYRKLTKELKVDVSNPDNTYYLNLLAGSINNKGYFHESTGNNVEALEYYGDALVYFQLLGDSISSAITMSNIAMIYDQQGLIYKALEFMHGSIMIRETIRDSVGLAEGYDNIGRIYLQQEDYDQVLKYSLRSLTIRKTLKLNSGLAKSYNNLGYLYNLKGDLPKSLEYYLESLKIERKIGRKEGIAVALSNMGMLYKKQGNYTNAMDYFQESLTLREEIGNRKNTIGTLSNIGFLLLERGNLDSAKLYGSQAYAIATEMNAPKRIAAPASLLYKIHKQEHMYKEALTMYEVYTQMKDSIKNSETQKATIRQQTKYEFEKAQLVKEQEEKEAARLLSEQTSRRNNLQYSLIFLGILLFFGLVLSLGFIRVSPSVAEGLIFFAFLILFEFLLVLADPFVSVYTGGEPIYNLVANALLAAAIFPAHAFFERTLKRRLIKAEKAS